MGKHYFGPQTERAAMNFPFSTRRTPKSFLYAIAEIKKAAAISHHAAHELDTVRTNAIKAACDEIIAGKHDEQFILPAVQGGAGTSNHMNVNEVIASRAKEMLQSKGVQVEVHPNDHINMSHSTNDVTPSALKITCIRLTDKLLASLDILAASFDKKAKKFANVPKLGRTHLQDAVPITLGDEFAAYGEYVRHDKKRIEHAKRDLFELNLGGSAVGNSINVSARYRTHLYRNLRKITGLPVRPARNLMAQTSSNADFVALSQALTVLCVDLSKIASDLRLLSSGPKGGFGEITLPELQAGSSIMPGKINPILGEVISQLYYLVSGNNLTIEHAAHGAQLELNVMLPVVVDRLIESLTLAHEVIDRFASRCILGITANRDRAKYLLEHSTAYATLLTPKIGYDAAAAAVKESLATGKTLRAVVIGKKLFTPKEFDSIVGGKRKAAKK